MRWSKRRKRRPIIIRSAEGKSRTSAALAAESAERAGQWALKRTGQQRPER